MTSESPSLVARLEARQQSLRRLAETIAAHWFFGLQGSIKAEADALDPILAELRRLQSQETKAEEAARVDRKCLSDRQDLSQPASGDTSARLLGEQWCRAALLKDRTRRAIYERHQAGDSVTDLAAEYDVPWDFVESLVARQMFREHDDWKERAHKIEAALAASEARQQALKAELAELNTLADTYATKHGGYVGNAKGVLLALLERDERAKGDR